VKANLERLGIIRWELQNLLHAIERVCHEIHMDGDDIRDILASHDSDRLEIMTDSADELLVKASAVLVEAQLVIGDFFGTSKEGPPHG